MPATVAAVGAGLLAAGGATVAFLLGARRRAGAVGAGGALVSSEQRADEPGAWRPTAGPRSSSRTKSRRRAPPAGKRSGPPTTSRKPGTCAPRSARVAARPRGPASRDDADVALARPGFGDAQWSYLYKSRDTSYAAAEPEPGQIAAANRRMREAPVPEVHGPFIKPPVWTWEVPLYFWVGGVASGASFAALGCDAAGDHRSAIIARRVALGAVMPAPLLLIADLGRPARFLNMMRIFKPRSPMNMGAWCLVVFSGTATGAVGADLLDRRRTASALGASTALLGGYLGSYTGVLLASTAVPVWAASRLLLGPIFVSHRHGHRRGGDPVGARGARPARPAIRPARALAHARDGNDRDRAHRSRPSTSAGSATSPSRCGAGAPGTLFRAAEAAVLLGLTAQCSAGRRSRARGRRGERAVPGRRAGVPVRLGRGGQGLRGRSLRRWPLWPADRRRWRTSSRSAAIPGRSQPAGGRCGRCRVSGCGARSYGGPAWPSRVGCSVSAGAALCGAAPSARSSVREFGSTARPAPGRPEPNSPGPVIRLPRGAAQPANRPALTSTATSPAAAATLVAWAMPTQRSHPRERALR